MGKKKKSSQPSPSQHKAKVTSQENRSKNVRDFMDLRLVHHHASKTTSESSPLVYFSEEDAFEMDVLNGDEVLVLSRENSKSAKVLASALCSARVILSKAGTPKMKPGSNSARVKIGDCRVTPTSVANRLCGISNESIISEQETPQKSAVTAAKAATTPSIQSPPPSTPSSSSKAKFSFARGGGGDTMISPTKSPSQRAAPATPKRATLQQTWVIPIRSVLGQQISGLLCRDAARIRMTPKKLSNLVSETTLQTAKRIMARLVLASSVGRYVQDGDILRSSFQGQSIEWNVEKTQEKENRPIENHTSLSDSLASLNLNDENGEVGDEQLDILDALEAAAEEDNNLRLFKIGHDTEIEISPVSNASSSTTTSEIATPLKRKKVVAGIDSTLENVKSLLLPPLVRPEIFVKGSLKPPRGVLLHGPSGVGKSILAKQVAMDLLNMGVNVQTVNCTTLQSHTAIVGEAERMLTRLFKTAEKQQLQGKGTLLVLDDVHLICPKRGGSNPGADRLSATLLALLDGIGSTTTTNANTHRKNANPHNVVILAITTNPSLLDAALRRPGRLDAEVEVPIPDEGTRGEILKFQISNAAGETVRTPELSDSDVMKLSRLAKGFNGADCMLAVKQALRAAIVRSTRSSTPPQYLYPPPPQQQQQQQQQVQALLTTEDLQSAIRATKPSTIKALTVEIPQVHWASIGGMESVKQMLREAIELPLTHAHLFEALHIPPPRGVLLYGPPGCSKTLMARALATEGHMNFLAVKGPELLSKWLGESERALASLFRRARMASPCIIFFDEMDAIASKRGSAGGGGGERLLSQLLTELDGVNNPGSAVVENTTDSSNGDGGDDDDDDSKTSKNTPNTKTKRVIVVGATNRPDLLDNALMRPGRMDRMIYVGLPDEASRESILRIGLKGKRCSDDIDVPALATEQVTGGFSGAEMISICREAALFAIEEDDENNNDDDTNTRAPITICMGHLQRAIEGTKRQITPEMLDFYASFRSKSSGP